MQRSNVDTVAKVFSGKGVPELVEEEVLAMRSFGTLVAVFGHALSAIQVGAAGHALHNHVVFAVGVAA